MNCFNNNRPKLSSSDKTRDIKSKAIFKGNVTDYQQRAKSKNITKSCNNYNGRVRFYNNGSLRNVRSYDKFFSLNRGSALCVDGAYKNCKPKIDASENYVIQRGLASCNRKGLLNTKVKIVTGMDSVYNRYSGISLFGSPSVANPFAGFLTSITWCPPFAPPTPKYFGINQLPTDAINDTSGNCITITDPHNNLFGSNFCPTDMANKSQGPNKYLAYTAATKYVKAEGFLFDNLGSQLDCSSSSPDLVKPGHLVISGLFSAANVNSSYTPGQTPSDLIKSPSFQWFTGAGIVTSVCCGIGPNGEENWWTVYIKILYGAFPPPQLLPITTIFPKDVTDPALTILTSQQTSQGVGGIKVNIGGVFKECTLPISSSSPWPAWQLHYGNHCYGGGLGFFPQSEGDKIFTPSGISVKSMMGYCGTWNNTPTQTQIQSFIKKPLLITEGAGLPCKRNLMFGNNTQQNYLVSYDPANEKVRFNIDPKLYTDFNL